MSPWSKSGLITLALAATSIAATPAFADPNLTFSTLGTDQDVYPTDLPYTYNAAVTKVLDVTSSTYIPQPFQIDFHDLETERRINGFRAVFREMYELQTLGAPVIRTRDLPSPYTSLLSQSCSYYQVSGISYPTVGSPSASECTPPTVSAAPTPENTNTNASESATQAPAAKPVPALW